VDCGNSQEVKETIKKIQSQMGRISVILWNAASYSGGDLMSEEDPASVLNQIVSVGCGGLLSSVQAAYDDLKKSKGTVLITGGGLSTYDVQVDEIAVDNNWMGLALCKSSQRKLAGLLHTRLKSDGIMVGTVIISGPVKIDGGHDVTDPNDVAKRFWNIHKQRPNKPEIHLGSLQPLVSSSTSDT
jgi:NADP-dependent 3-hydroxy acid dehydrogenase YdfG